MREIKFRGWSIKEQKWVYGYLTASRNLRFYKEKFRDCYFIDDAEGSITEVDPESVGQYTGIKDSKGREIYEGDILGGVCIHGSIADAVVDFKNGRFSVVQKTGEKYTDDVCCYSAYMIIGTIFENQEMLEVE